MRASPPSNVQAARRALAGRLREIRLDAGLTAKDLAAEAGWDRTKVSKVEHAARPPNTQDIRTWCEVCNATDQAEDLLASLRAAEGAYVEWRRLQRTGLRRLQESRVPLFERTRLFRIYCSQVVPGLLQTPEYARALLSAIATQHGAPDDVDDAVAARTGRAKVLREGDHRFAFVIEEAALYYQLGDAETMAGQLGRLLSVVSLPSVSLGIIPFAVPGGRPIWTLGNFSMYDDAEVRLELLTAAVTVTAPSEIAEYAKVFEALSAMAVTGPSARTLISRAIEAFD